MTARHPLALLRPAAFVFVFALLWGLLLSECAHGAWQVNGNPVCPGKGDQEYPEILPSGSGGAILAWQDHRSHSWDIYAQRIDETGNLLWGAYGISTCSAPGDQEYPVLTSDGAGGAIVVWQDSRSGSGNSYVYAQRLNSNGAIMWSANGVAVCATDSDQDRPQAISDGAGGAIVVWQDHRNNNWDVYGQRIDQSGTPLWAPTGLPIYQGTGDQTLPKVIPDGIGGAVIAWRDNRNGSSNDIYAQRIVLNGSLKWGDAGKTICGATGDQFDPVLTSDGVGGAIITWTDARAGTSYDVYAQRVDSLGSVGWATDGVVICATTGVQTLQRIASDGNHGAIVTWQDSRSSRYHIYSQRIDGSGVAKWAANGVAICVAANSQFNPEITPDGVGGAIVTWDDSRSGYFDIYAQRIDGSGVVKWTTDGVPICRADGDKRWPVIGPDGAGGAMIAWWDLRNNANYDICIQRADLSGAMKWELNGVAAAIAPSSQYEPRIAPSGPGGAVIAWEDARSDTSYDIYVQLVDSTGALQWTGYGLSLCTTGNDQQYPEIVSDGAGGAIVVWRDEPTDSSDLYAQCVSGLGAIKWVTNGVPVCVAAGRQENHKIISDGAHGAVVAWNDYKAGTSDIYAQRITSSGSVAWAVDGVSICSALSFQVQPDLTSDGAGGAIIAWSDYRNRTHYDIYAQRVNSSGVVQWPTNGVAVCSAVGDQVHAKTTSDGAGGVIVVWQDYRNGSNYDIYAQRVNASGVAQWAASGVAICTADWNQESCDLIPDGAGGAIIVWQDHRSGTNYDIYAQRVNASGSIQWNENGVPVSAAQGDQERPKLASDSSGGAMVTWQDYSSGAGYDIYVQRVNASGASSWPPDGLVICEAPEDQMYPVIIPAIDNAATVTWQDWRGGASSSEIYAVRVRTDVGTSGVGEAAARYGLSLLSQNVPNPFNPLTSIAFSIERAGIASLRIYDVSGRPVRTLAKGWRDTGRYRVVWDGRDDVGSPVASGVYVCRLETNGTAESKKMVLLR